MKIVRIESPYAGDVEENIRYARAAMRDSLYRGEAPFASHLLYTQCLDDNNPTERAMGIAAGLCDGWRFDLVAVYVDRGTSSGMLQGIDRALAQGVPVEYRRIGLTFVRGLWTAGEGNVF